MVSKCKDAKQRKKEKDTAMQKNISLVQDVKRQMVLDDRLPPTRFENGVDKEGGLRPHVCGNYMHTLNRHLVAHGLAGA